MKKIIIIGSILIIILIVSTYKILSKGIDKELKEYISTNTIELNNINPSDDNIEGYSKLLGSVGNSRLVMLGEQDHGDAATFLAKTKIIKELHKKKSFNVIIFESDFHNLSISLDKEKQNNDYKKFIYPHWTECQEVSELLNFIDQNSSTIKVVGSDPRIFPNTKLDDIINKLEKELPKEIWNESKKALKEAEVILSDDVADDDTVNRLSEKIRQISEYLEESTLLYQQIINLEGNLRIKIDNSNNTRDTYIAKNIEWMMKYPLKDEKVIFWAANYHIVDNFESMIEMNQRKGSKDTINVGTLLRDNLNLESYILTFTSGRGTAGRLFGENYEVTKTLPKSIEWEFDKLNEEYLFVNFDENIRSKQNEKFFMKTFAGQYEYNDWTKMVDGIFYIGEMFPCSNKK
ncbi:erythromycin esterase family protein [Penaeicola halotolerans]|uniref:erythromycin esterase family protein n=1 Tax=Penaeicola halotolerans TaxID=2793196 RepID=UPI001CF846BA|nr:erythromycin esterase family protein [Penaeicola halotolerans]